LEQLKSIYRKIIKYLETKASELDAFASTYAMQIILLEAKAAELAQLASTDFLL
jgi:hypothetical protein